LADSEQDQYQQDKAIVKEYGVETMHEQGLRECKEELDDKRLV
jgi:hypothetical protein